MRPRELTVQGFRSYRDRTVIDLRGRRLVGVVGPIGSGKSSLLDAITFALYGRTPSAGSRSRSLIHQLSDAAHVELVFEVEGQIWRAQRAIRRKGQSQHKLERLDGDATDAAPTETVTQEKPTNERVAALLGLGFDAFCRSVMLAQNRFAEFLKATPTQRDEVLAGVFGYERFDRALAISRERVAAATATVAALEDEGRRLLDAKATLLDAEAAKADADERVTAIEARWPAIEGATAAMSQGAAEVAETTTRLEAIEAIARDLPGAGEVNAAGEAAEHAEALVAKASRDLAEAEAAETEALAGRDAVAAAAERDRAFHELVATFDARAASLAETTERRDRAASLAETATASSAKAEAKAGAAEEAVAAAIEHAAQAESDRARAAEQLHEARHGEMTAELRRQLHEDTPCPVCEQVVVVVPPDIAAPGLVEAEEALAAAEAGAQGAAVRVAAAQAAAADTRARAETAADAARQAAGQLKEAQVALGAATAELDAIRSELVDQLGEGDHRALLDARAQELRLAEAALDRARAATATARATLEEAQRAGADAGQALARIAAALTNAWGRLGERAEVTSEPDDVRRALALLSETLIERRDGAVAARGAAVARVDEAETILAAEREALGMEPDEDPAEARSTALARAAAAAERVAALAEAIAGAADLDTRLTEAVRARDLAKHLVADLQPSRLRAFLLEEERAALADLGSVHLEQLTASAYRFADDDTFAIADQNAGGLTRAPDSLSGGETFLASLALALALAEMVARGGGRLDAFFLDEGFGSLDPEHLDRAMEGIERLVAEGEDRLVVVVSHVEQMRHTIEDLIELDKDPRTGDTIVRRGAALAG